ncbi:PREDICTED: putative late blight resistance protein homolog R1B-16 [Ipomoea nil]|uniref:putative late blight resistance protein homolog R1B-16 n=1 Tax=Ipomoea nil TaxID=35883 RepID=UPI0009013D34|nr:PREDICTED: putative late blight resistance protein homolog R1B-16 [Ipomoea nil]
MACVAVNSLITTLELEFLQPHPRPILQQMELIPFNKDLIQSLHAKLGFLIQLFDEFRMDGVEAIKDLETKLRDVAFRVEDEIEHHVVHLYKEADDEMGQGDTEAKKTQHSHRLSHVLQQAIKDIDAIKEELEKVMMEYKHVIAVQGRETTLDDDVNPKSDDELVKMDGSSSSNHASHTDDIMVGKNNEFEIIRKMLIQHPSKQREVSIQGMGGIGKTTLARRVYEDPSIVSHFDKQIWVVVSQHHNKRQMLLDLVAGSKDNLKDSSDEDLALKLYQSLKGQRYLVVMDDVWSRESWNEVNSCFPDDINGSRVLLTTRVAEVATCIGSNNYFSHQMQFLDQSESWELFHKKACKSQGVEFDTIGRPIVEKCKGLPLAIVVVAGLFSKLNTLHEWKKTANALISSTSTSTLDDEECWTILSLSYSHLPHNLKACFLYLGVFPEDKVINANNLARLWAAEGLVKALKNESFEAVAKRYINELMDRNLILVSKRSSCGRKIKEFRVHDLLHAFCVREGHNQSLLHVVDESGCNFPQKGVRWIRIERVSFKDFDISALHSLSKHCRSIFHFALSPIDSIILEIFSLLRVLYVAEYLLPTPTDVHIHLRYLWISRQCDSCHSFFSNAWNLQTYRVFHDMGLRHLELPQLQYISCRKLYGSFPEPAHQNLQVISSLQASQCDQESLTKVPYLKRVGITIGNPNDCIKNIDCLQQLESLSLHFDSLSYGIRDMMAQIINNILLLKNIRKLRFDFMKSEWKAINVLSKLPRFEVLKLRYSKLGKKWEVPENVKFCHLICLKISHDNLKHWEVGADNFPKLERLFLNKCFKLREIPNSFAEIPTLNLIQLKRCRPSAVMSAKQIEAEQHDYGNENMVVIEIDTIEFRPLEDDSDEGEFDEDDSDEGEFDEDDSDEGEFDKDDSDEGNFDEDDSDEGEFLWEEQMVVVAVFAILVFEMVSGSQVLQLKIGIGYRLLYFCLVLQAWLLLGMNK